MVCAQVIGNDVTIAIAGQSGNFELNVMMPVARLQPAAIDSPAGRQCGQNFAVQCIERPQGDRPRAGHGRAGTDARHRAGAGDRLRAAAALAKEAAPAGRTIREVARERTELSEEELDRILDSGAMTEPGNVSAGSGG